MAYTVAQRSAEIGIRMALGARAVNVQQMVIRQGTKLAFVGVLIGVAGALALTQLMNAFLFEVRAADPLIYLAISAMLVAVAVSACWIPARRAARVDPMQALHSA
jgi:ABC-type antimicrobial peptide transport system permease subunit